MAIDAELQAGEDNFTVLARSTISGSRISRAVITRRGGAGSDFLGALPDGVNNAPLRIDLNGLLDIELPAGAVRTRSASISRSMKTSSKVLEGTLRVRVLGGSGKDGLFLGAVNTDASAGVYDLALFGGKGDDLADFFLDKQNGTPTFGPA